MYLWVYINLYLSVSDIRGLFLACSFKSLWNNVSNRSVFVVLMNDPRQGPWAASGCRLVDVETKSSVRAGT